MNHIACRHNFAVANSYCYRKSSSSVLLDERDGLDSV